MRERAVNCFSSAADHLKGPAGYMASPAFRHLRWTIAGDQRRGEMRLFCRKLLKRLDGLGFPFFPAVGLMDAREAQRRYVVGIDPWRPIENPYLDGSAIGFQHCVHEVLDRRSWFLFGEIGFDVARLASIPVMWGGFSIDYEPGTFMLYDGSVPEGWQVDRRTYGSKVKWEIEFDPLLRIAFAYSRGSVRG